MVIHKNANENKKKCTYNEITTYISNENYDAALDLLENLNYKDSDKMISFCNDIKNDNIEEAHKTLEEMENSYFKTTELNHFIEIPYVVVESNYDFTYTIEYNEDFHILSIYQDDEQISLSNLQYDDENRIIEFTSDTEFEDGEFSVEYSEAGSGSSFDYATITYNTHYYYSYINDATYTGKYDILTEGGICENHWSNDFNYKTELKYIHKETTVDSNTIINNVLIILDNI